MFEKQKLIAVTLAPFYGLFLLMHNSLAREKLKELMPKDCNYIKFGLSTVIR